MKYFVTTYFIIVLDIKFFSRIKLKKTILVLGSNRCINYLSYVFIFLLQLIGGLLLGLGAILLGLMSYFFADRKHRRAFLETRQSLEMKMVIEDESKEQVRENTQFPSAQTFFLIPTQHERHAL